MKQFILALVIGLGAVTSGLSNPNESVVFGDHQRHAATVIENGYRIFSDMNGDFYPEAYIDNKELKSTGRAQLSVWAKKFPQKFQHIAHLYHLADSAYSETNYRVLQDSIIGQITRSVNQLSGEKRVTCLIHGFRKRLVSPNGRGNSTSLDDNQAARNRMNSVTADLGLGQTFYLEVYWDGKYVPSKGKRSAIRLARLFKNHAVPNARRVGASLRQVFGMLNSADINVISHSTGTHVVAALILNKNGKEKNGWQTPSQRLHISLLASASAGTAIFKDYYKRSVQVDSMDNYRLSNLYNPSDYVLRKAGFPRRFGVTTLGCNCKQESDKLDTYFEEHFPRSVYEDFPARDIGSAHAFTRYVESGAFVTTCRFLYELDLGKP